MTPLDLKKIDLNLLLIFEVLMAERSVTRAAVLLGRTQSAISHSLARLREQLEDPILIKQGGQMVPSPLALELIEQIEPVLRNIQTILTPREVFDPKKSTRVFKIATSDFGFALVSKIVAKVLALAPQTSLEWIPLDSSSIPKMLMGQIDLMLASYQPQLPDGVGQEVLGEMHWQCYGRRGHPAFDNWGLREWLKWPHAAVRISDKLYNPVRDAQAKAGVERRVSAWVPYFCAMAPMLEGSDMLTTQLDMLMDIELQHYDLERKPSPIDVPPVQSAILWNSRTENEPAISWLRNEVSTLCKALYIKA